VSAHSEEVQLTNAIKTVGVKKVETWNCSAPRELLLDVLAKGLKA
jgi:hypothetical protein